MGTLPDHVTGRDELPIGGGRIPGEGAPYLVVENPATGEPMGSCPAAGVADVDAAVTAARRAFDRGPWPRMSHAERAARLRDLWARYLEAADTMAALITAQNGSPVSFTAQTEHPLDIINWYADVATTCPWVQDRGGGLTVRLEPVGVVAAIVPWNMPQKTIIMKLAPALLAGCTVIIKPAPQTPLDALLLADLCAAAGIPPGVVNVAPALPEVAERLIVEPGVDKLAFTGSTAAGRRLAALAALSTVRVSLELGGKSPAIALPDADPAVVVESLRRETFTMAGQICSAHTRLLVPYDRQEEYAARAAALTESLKVGDPTDPATEVGPLISTRQQRRVIQYIRQAVRQGATIAAGDDTPPDRPGHYATPTVLTDVDPLSAAGQEEIFGPVLTVIPYHDADDVALIADGTIYGLEAAIWTGDPARATDLAHRLRVGTVRINGAPAPLWAPLGGFKHSGYGRELGPEGLAGYLECKAILR